MQVSDAKRAFETKLSEKSSSPRRKSSISGGSDSSLSKDSSKEGVSKVNTKQSSVTKEPIFPKDEPVIPNENDGSQKNDISETKAKSPSKTLPSKKSPSKESLKKEKSPSAKQKSPSKSPLKEQKETATKSTNDESKKDDKPSKETEIVIKTGEKIKSKEKDSKIINEKEKVSTSAPQPVKVPITVHDSKVSKPKVSNDKSTGGLNVKSGSEATASEGRTSQAVIHGETSDSSDSESEAERVLRLVSEKREKLEAAKREKLRKVSEAKERDTVKHDMPSIREEAHSKSPSKSPEKGKVLSNDNSDQKFATLPRGFKSKPTAKQQIRNDLKTKEGIVESKILENNVSQVSISKII